MLCGILTVVVIPTFVLACCPPKQWEGIEYTALGSTGADGKTHYTEVCMSLLQKLFLQNYVSLSDKNVELK